MPARPSSSRRSPPPRVARRSAPRQARRPRVRLAPAERRQQLVDVASVLLTELGAGGVEIKEVARRAGVTRPVVYRFFPTRLALIAGVLESFEAELSARYQRALLSSMGETLEDIATTFIEASCDAIEARGKGAWHLFYARGSDLEAAQLGGQALTRLLSPWMPRVAELTGLPVARARHLVDVVVAAGGAALDGWLDGPLRRKDGVAMATRAVAALLREFAGGARMRSRPTAAR
jgi:AcrR family transcriptional regulator